MVYIVIVNWNRWRLTLECLESVLRLKDADFRVIVCDNASEDGSIRHLVEWANGGGNPNIGSNADLHYLSNPPIAKPIRYAIYDRVEAEQFHATVAPLIVINTGSNLGFAGANNVGLRFALRQADFEFAWLLNNDTVVEANALSALVVKARTASDIGICGSTILYYDRPTRVQALGGARISKLLARERHLGGHLHKDQISGMKDCDMRLDYVVGASMLVRREFIEDIGLMNEDYFLYFEEIDWALRGRSRYRLAYARESIVYHREGASTGAGGASRRYSFRSDFYSFRSRLLFSARFAPYSLPLVASMVGAVCVERVLRRRWKLSEIQSTLEEYRNRQMSRRQDRPPLNVR